MSKNVKYWARSILAAISAVRGEEVEHSRLRSIVKREIGAGFTRITREEKHLNLAQVQWRKTKRVQIKIHGNYQLSFY